MKEVWKKRRCWRRRDCVRADKTSLVITLEAGLRLTGPGNDAVIVKWMNLM